VSRETVIQDLKKYRQKHPNEAGVVDRLVEFVREQEDCFERSLLQGHVTGSVWLVDPSGLNVLLTHHRKLNKWFQLGGHVDGNSNVLEAARREAEEESGLQHLSVIEPGIFDIDIHLIPGRKLEPEHYHYDIRYAFQALGSTEYHVSAESLDLKWVPIDQIREYTTEESMLRMAEKWKATQTMNSQQTQAEILESIIRARKTDKITCEIEDRRPVPDERQKHGKATVLHSLEVAGWAPFHYPSNDKNIHEPWRAYVLWDDEVSQLLRELTNEHRFKQSKLQKLTAACSALVLVTWIPEQRAEIKEENRNKINEENLAAAAAMVQNFLLMLTAHGMSNYWSSGGDLGKSDVFEILGIPKQQRLIAAVFIEYNDMKNLQPHKTCAPGKHRDKRSTNWIQQTRIH